MPNYHVQPDEAQRVTIQSYNDHIEEYMQKVNADDVRTIAYWPGVQYFLDQLPPGQRIFEIGSGSGADAQRIEAQGFVVQRTDVTEAFLQRLRQRGHQAERFDILSEPSATKQVAIFANAVFLHFTPPQLHVALAHVQDMLTPDGLFCMGMKLGDFDGWREKGLSGKRYFKFWQLDDLQAALQQAGYGIVHTAVTPAKDFVVITAKKL